MEKVFKRSYELTLLHEGIWSNNKFDSGGKTYCGIARNSHPDWEGWPIVDTHIQQFGRAPNPQPGSSIEWMVRNFYYANFWLEPKFDQVAEIFNAVAIELFDTGVNGGPAKAVELLQSTLNIMNRRGEYWRDIPEDGGVGPQTISALQKAIAIRGKDKVYSRLNLYQAKFYIDLMRANPEKYEEFEGWFNRVNLDYRTVIEGL